MKIVKKRKKIHPVDDNGNELFIVICGDHNYKECEVSFCEKTASEIISFEDMSDCHNIPYKVYRMTIDPETLKATYTEVKIHGCWHDPKDPLYIKGTIKVPKSKKHPDGMLKVFSGYGVDH